MSWTINEGINFGLGIAGNATALGLFIAPLRTMIGIIRSKSTEEYSVFPYVTTLLNCLLWCWYGVPFVGEGRMLVITINSLGIFMETCYILLFFAFQVPKQKIRTVMLTSAVLGFFGAVGAITAFVFYTTETRSQFVGIICDVGTVAMYASPLEIMWLVIRTRSVKYMPFFLSVLALANGTAWTTYAVYVRDIYIIIPNSLGMLLGIAQLILYSKYHSIEVAEIKREKMDKSMSEQSQSSSDSSSMNRIVSVSGESASSSDGSSVRTDSRNCDVELAIPESRMPGL